MFAKLKETAARLRPPKQERVPDPAGVTIPESLVASAKIASWMAYFALVYFLWLYTLDIARDRAQALHLTQAGMWAGDLSFYFPYIIGFGVVAVGIPWVAKIAIPVFMSLSWKGQFWPKLWALLIAISVSTVIVAGTFAVQADTLMERDRGAAVAVAETEQEAAVLTARIADRRAELDDMVNNASVYVRTAASMSPDAYRAFVESRRDDWQYDRLLSYQSTSDDAQRLRDEIAALREDQARQTVTAAVSGRVETAGTSWIGATLDWLEGARAILLSLVMDLVCLIMPWIALRLEQARAVQLARAEAPTVEPPQPMDESHMVPDMRGQDAPEWSEGSQREVVAAYEDLAEKRSEAARKGWMRRKQKVQTREGGSFETDGVVEEKNPPLSDEDNRVARVSETTAPEPQEIAAAAVAAAAAAEIVIDEDEPLDDETAAALAAMEDVDLPDGEGVMVRETA